MIHWKIKIPFTRYYVVRATSALSYVFFARKVDYDIQGGKFVMERWERHFVHLEDTYKIIFELQIGN